MMEPLIRWINSKKKGYQFGSTKLTLASKWYADDATLLSNSAPDMISQLQVVDSYSSWSGIRLNVPKCCITGFMQQLQSITRKADRDNALRGRLAHIQVSGQRIKAVSQDEPLPGGYLGTALTASLNPQAQLTWIKTILNDICRAVIKAPLPPRVRQQLLLYGAHSKIMHTHCLLALSPLAITQLDSILESACRRIWNLPACFPRTALHAPHKEWGLNLPTLWEDYCASAVRIWTTILNDQGALGLTAKASLIEAATKFAQWPLELAFSSNKHGTPLCTSLSAKCMATVIMGDLHPLGGPPMWEGNPISRSLITAIPISVDEDGCPLPTQPFPRVDSILRQLTPLWSNGINSWGQLARLDPGGRPYLLPEDELLWANPHLTPSLLTAMRRSFTYLHRLMASTSPTDMARTSSRAAPKHIQRGQFAPRWRALLHTTLSALPAAPSPLELIQALKQTNIRTFLTDPVHTKSPQRRSTSQNTRGGRNPIRLFIRPTFGARTRREPKRRRVEPVSSLHPPPPRGGSMRREGASITRIISRQKLQQNARGSSRSTSVNDAFLVEWGPEKCPHHVVTSLQQQHGFVISSLLVLEDFDESATVNEEELDPPCVSCAKGGGDSMDPNLIQCERCMQWIHSYCLPTPLATSEILLVKGWTCPQCAPPSVDDPCPNQMCLVQFAPSLQRVKHILKTPGGGAAMRTFRRHERRLPQPPQATHFQLDSSPTHPPTPPAIQKSPRPPSHRTKSLGRPTGRNGKRGRGAPDPSSPQPPSSPRLPPPPQRTPQQDLNLRRQRELIIRGGSRRATPSHTKKIKLGPPPPRHACPQHSPHSTLEQHTSSTAPPPAQPHRRHPGSPPSEGKLPIKRSSSAQAPTRIRKGRIRPRRPTRTSHPPLSPPHHPLVDTSLVDAPSPWMRETRTGTQHHNRPPSRLSSRHPRHGTASTVT